MTDKVRSIDEIEKTEEAPSRALRTRSEPSSRSDTALPGLRQAAGNLAVQRARKSRDSRLPSAHVHTMAQKGVSGPDRALPHRERIQASFGSAHDLSGVRAHVGGPTAAAATGMDAHAFTTGSHVAFESDPPLHLAAHEATHIVQQRQGVNLSGGVGHAGDPYERHADAVAERVVSGRSAADLLAPFPTLTSSAPAVQRQEAAAETPAQKIQRLIADNDNNGIVGLKDDELAASTAQQRAGMVRVLAEQSWTSENDERVMLLLICFNAQHVDVLTTLDALGYRQRLLDSVDTEAFHQQLKTLLDKTQAPAAAPDDVVARALTSRESRDVMAITDFSRATMGQRLGLLQILLNMSSSSAAEEAKILDILESSGGGLGALMQSLRDLGLKQSLFDHIDDDANKLRLTTLLQTLNDAELNRDLEVFNRGFLGNVWEGFAGALEKFSIKGLVMGLVQPILQPLDTAVHLVDEVAVAYKHPTVDTVLTAFRDVIGTLALWCLVISAACLAVAAVLFGAAVLLVETGPLAAVLATIALALVALFKFFFAAATFLGTVFLVLAALKVIVDLIQAGTATTARELEVEQEHLATGLAVLAIWAVAKIIGRVAKRFRRSTTDGDAGDPDKMQEQSEEVKQDEAEAKSQTDEAQKAAEEQKAIADEQQRVAEEQKRAAEDARRAAEEQKTTADEPQRAADEQKRATEDAQKAAEEQKATVDERVAEEQKKAAEDAQKPVEEAEKAADESKEEKAKEEERRPMGPSENIPKPTPEEYVQIDRYVRALSDFLDGLETNDAAKEADATKAMDEIDQLANREYRKGGDYEHLLDHILALSEARSRIKAGWGIEGSLIYPVEVPPGRGTWVEGIGRHFPDADAAKVEPLRGKTYSELEEALGGPPTNPPEGTRPGAVRLTWVLPDNSMIHVDYPGESNPSPYELSRNPHAARIGPDGIHMDEGGVGVPVESTPAHIEIKADPLLRRRVDGDYD